MIPKLWAVGPNVIRGLDNAVYWDHDNRRLHRVFIREIGGIGDPNGGEFLVETPCGYRGWTRRLNQNPKARPACEKCLNGCESKWLSSVPEGAIVADLRPKRPESDDDYSDDCPDHYADVSWCE